MTMDVSRLGIEVQSTGITDATAALRGLGAQADATETKVSKLTATLNNLTNVNMSGTMQAWAAAMGGIQSAMANIASSVQGTVGAINTQVNAINTQINALNASTAATARASQANSTYAGSSGVFVNTLKAMTSAALGYTAINFAMSIVHNADEWTQLNTKMIAATGSQNNATVAMQQAYDISQKLSQPLDGVIKLYSRLAPAMAQAGKDSATTEAVVQGLATALRLGGASTSEANAAMLNFAHAMSAGSINAREFNSLSREAPLLLRALANQMTGGNVGALKLLASTGKVSIDQIIKAIQTMQPEWDKQLAAMPLTVENALTQIKNTWLKSIGELGQSTGFNTELADGLKVIEAMIPQVVNGLGNAFMGIMKWITQNKDALAEVWNQVVGLISDVIQVGENISKWVGSIISAGNEFSLFGEIVFSIRLAVAGIQDGLVLVKDVIANTGAMIVSAMLSPINWIIEGLAKIIEGWSKLLSLAAAGANAIGQKDMSKNLVDAAVATQSFSDKLKGASTDEKEFFKQIQDDAKQSAQDIMDGKGAVGQLMDSAGQATEALKKMNLQYQENYNKHPTPPVDPKALAAAQKLTNEYNKQMEALQVMIDQQTEIANRLQTYGLAYDKLGPAQKELIKLQDNQNQLIAKGADALALVRAQHEVDRAAEAAALEKQNEDYQKLLTAGQNRLTTEKDLVKTLQDQAEALEAKASGKASGTGKVGTDDQLLQNAIDRRDAAVADQAIVMPDSLAEVEQVNQMVEALNKEVAARQRILDANKAIQAETIDQEIAKLLDPTKVDKWTDAMTKGFGAIGKGITGVVNAMQGFEKSQETVQKTQALIDKEAAEGPAGAAKAITDQAALNAKAAQDQLGNYAAMTEGAQEFFKKGTDGYAIMGAADKAFRIAELAMAVENFLQKSGFLVSYTALHTAATAEQTSVSVAGGLAQAAAEIPKQIAYGISALAAALTIPPPASYVAFAATAALLLAIGVAVAGSGGSGSAPSSAQRQASQGTGTVLGDSTKQSESIANSIKNLSDNSNIALTYSQGMLSSLQSIQNALTGTTNAIALNSSPITGSGYVDTVTGTMKDDLKTAFTGGLTSFLSGSLSTAITGVLGIKSSTTLTDSGILAASQTIGQILSNGFKASSYQDTTSKHSVFGIGLGSSNNQSTQALDPNITNNFTEIVKGMAATVTQAAEALGMSGTQVAATLNNITLSLGNISLKGLTSDQINTQLSAVFSAFGDQITTAVLGPTIGKFQQAGEGLLQTAVRVASGVEDANFELGKLGLTAINFTDIINTSGDVATELVRQTIMLKEGTDGISQIIATMSGTADQLVTTYQSLVSVKLALQQVGIASDVSAELINAAGGLDTLSQSLQDYQKDFFTSAQQTAMATQALQQQFAALGLAMPTSNAAFVDLVNQLSASGSAGQDLATKVIGLADAFNNLSTAAADNISTLQGNLTDAYNAQSDSLSTLITNMKGFSTSLETFKTTLQTGDLATGNAVDQYNLLKAQYQQTETAAAGGDQTALGNFQDIAQQFLKASQAVFASGGNYTSDFNTVLTDTQTLADSTANQADVATQQLTALQTLVSQFVTINTSVESVTDAITALQAALTAGVGGTVAGTTKTIQPVTPTVNGSHAMGLANVPWDGYIAELHKGEAVLTASENKAYQSGNGNEALVASVQALRSEVAGLRADAHAQTGAVVGAVIASSDDNAEKIVSGTSNSNKQAAYAARAKVKLA